MRLRHRQIELQHGHKDQRIGQAVRQPVVTSQRVSQRVHRSDRRVGEGHAGKEGADQHVLAHHRILAMTDSRAQVGIKQLQGLDRQRVRQRILLQACAEGFHCMHHRIHAGHGGDSRGQSQRQSAVEQRQIRVEQG